MEDFLLLSLLYLFHFGVLFQSLFLFPLFLQLLVLSHQLFSVIVLARIFLISVRVAFLSHGGVWSSHLGDCLFRLDPKVAGIVPKALKVSILCKWTLHELKRQS